MRNMSFIAKCSSAQTPIAIMMSAAVSPIARAIARISPVMIPGSAFGSV